MKWTGLTGGIATGKSTASALLEGLGIPVIDADQISHGLTEVGKAGYQGIVSHFGTVVLKKDQTLDRKKIAEMVFSDTQKKSELEDILHPLIRQEVQLQKKHYKNRGAELCFYDVPLLFEKNLSQEFNYTVLVWCNRRTQLQRLIERNKLSPAEAEQRINNQLPMIDKVRMANFCLDNSGDILDLEKQIRKLIKNLAK